MSASQELFFSEHHPVSRRRAVVEDDGRVAWLYLTELHTRKPIADCWLYNRVATPPQFDSVRGQSPVVPQTYAAENSTRQLPAKESVRILWSPDGESVAAIIEGDIIGFIAKDQTRGYSRYLRVSGPFGNVLDIELYHRLFSGP